jgi:hypothetical protein
MNIRQSSTAAKRLSGIVALALTTGCASIQSEAVRDLITTQGKHISAAKGEASAFVDETRKRTASYRNSLASMDEAFKAVQANEARQALIFSSNQNVSTKTGVDANAAAYMIAALYFADYAGLQKEVKDQFEVDFKALEDLSGRIRGSWTSLEKLHAEIEKYSKQSAIASVDPAFISALLQQTRIDSQDIDRVINASKHVNDVLSKASQIRVTQGQTLDRSEKTLNDLIDLLDRVKKTPAK